MTNKSKIADFGMSQFEKKQNKDSISGTISKISSNSEMNVRWNAPEIFNKSSFSKESDVWSFGVLMWEIASRQQPYKNLSNAQVIQLVLEKGFSLEKTEGMNDHLYEIMQRCCSVEPVKRPHFAELTAIFHGMKKHTFLRTKKSTNSIEIEIDYSPLTDLKKVDHSVLGKPQELTYLKLGSDEDVLYLKQQDSIMSAKHPDEGTALHQGPGSTTTNDGSSKPQELLYLPLPSSNSDEVAVFNLEKKN